MHMHMHMHMHTHTCTHAEHLEIMTKDAMEVAMKCNHYGGLFVGRCSSVCLSVWLSG